jgi:hypothetical protein
MDDCHFKYIIKMIFFFCGAMIPFGFFSMFWCKKFDDFLAKTLVEITLKK